MWNFEARIHFQRITLPRLALDDSIEKSVRTDGVFHSPTTYIMTESLPDKTYPAIAKATNDSKFE